MKTINKIMGFENDLTNVLTFTLMAFTLGCIVGAIVMCFINGINQF